MLQLMESGNLHRLAHSGPCETNRSPFPAHPPVSRGSDIDLNSTKYKWQGSLMLEGGAEGSLPSTAFWVRHVTFHFLVALIHIGSSLAIHQVISRTFAAGAAQASQATFTLRPPLYVVRQELSCLVVALRPRG